jgi:hypothetical protein
MANRSAEARRKAIQRFPESCMAGALTSKRAIGEACIAFMTHVVARLSPIQNNFHVTEP